jgi:hypothetical protein
MGRLDPHRWVHAFGVALVSMVAACSASSHEDTTEDALDARIDAFFSDASRLDLGDLVRVSAGYASDSLNDELSGDNFGVFIDGPHVFGAQAEPNRVLPGGAQVQDLTRLVDDLNQKFGAREFGAEVNRARLDAIRAGLAHYYVEGGLQLRAGLQHGWSFPAPGIAAGGSVTIGFDVGGRLESRVVHATEEGTLEDALQSPLKAIRTRRGFVIPRSLDDIRQMKPGEAVALRGLGRMAANVGLGVPIVTAEPTGLLYRVVASGGTAVNLEGRIDVQLVRLSGDEIAIDVGIQDMRVLSVRAGVADEFGIKGLCDDGAPCLRDVRLGPVNVKLSTLIERAVENRLNADFHSRTELSKENASTRVALSRMRIHIDRGDPREVSAAVAQALKLDLRLAQAIANRDLGRAEPVAVADVDVMRTATTASFDFGFELLGMNVYRRTIVDRTGTFVLQTPEGASAITFDTLEQHHHFLQTDHGYSRLGVGARSIDAASPTTWRSEANLFVRASLGDKHVDDDRVLDSLDGLVGAIAGTAALDAMDRSGGQMQRRILERCPLPDRSPSESLQVWDESCNVALLGDPSFTALRDAGVRDLAAASQGLPNDFRELVAAAGGMRLKLQSVLIHELDVLNGAGLSLALDVRFDDTALATLTGKSATEFRDVLREVLASAVLDRSRVGVSTSRADARADVDQRYGKAIQAMADLFVSRASTYRGILEMERRLPAALVGKQFVASPLGVRFAVTPDSAVDYASAAMTSTSHERARTATRLFDDLVNEANSVGGVTYPEQAVVGALLSLVPARDLKAAFSFDSEVKDSFLNPRARFRVAGIESTSASAKGESVSEIALPDFDLEQIAGTR